MRIKKDLKIKLLNLKIKKLDKFQLSQTYNLKSFEGKRISKFQLKNINQKLFFKEKLKFPLNLISSESKKDLQSLIYLKKENLHVLDKNLRLLDSLSIFQNFYKLTTNYSFLKIFKL